MQFRTLFAALASIAILAVAPVYAQTVDTTAFVKDCVAGAPSLVGAELAASQASRLPELCSCTASGLAGASQDDLNMLAADILGSNTDALRQAYSNYGELTAKANEALSACMKTGGFADAAAAAATPVAPPDMAAFNDKCFASPALKELVASAPVAEDVARGALCSCLSSSLSTQFDQGAIDMLGQELDGTATEESRKAYPDYETISTKADMSMGPCFKALLGTQ